MRTNTEARNPEIHRDTSSFCHWDDALPYIVLGYRCGKQKATNLSPYEMLYGVAPTIPPAIMERVSDVIDYDDVEAATSNLLTRRQVLKDHCIMAGDNILIAQQLDRIRYSQIRSGSYHAMVLCISET